MSASRDAEYTEYVSARLPTLRRLAVVLCQDWQRADDLVQATITKLYVHWGRASAADHVNAYARAVLVREFVHERRSSWARRVSLSAGVADSQPPPWTTMPRSTCGRPSPRCRHASAPPWCCASTATWTSISPRSFSGAHRAR